MLALKNGAENERRREPKPGKSDDHVEAKTNRNVKFEIVELKEHCGRPANN
jgi:hypothetical protein